MYNKEELEKIVYGDTRKNALRHAAGYSRVNFLDHCINKDGLSWGEFFSEKKKTYLYKDKLAMIKNENKLELELFCQYLNSIPSHKKYSDDGFPLYSGFFDGNDYFN